MTDSISLKSVQDRNAEIVDQAWDHPQIPPVSEFPRPTKSARLEVKGKFFYQNGKKVEIRGVTYGPFRPEADGSEYHTPRSARRDLLQMKNAGVNAVRTYTPPPDWFLDLAFETGIWVMVGLPWEQHITFLDDGDARIQIGERVRKGAKLCAGHPALFAFAIGNEIPSPIVRWHGPSQSASFLKRLYSIVKEEDPRALVTYVNYPTTEYLDLDFVDFVSFNVYLEEQANFEAYLARLQNLSGNRPLLMAEIGLDSRSNGEAKQAETLGWHIDSVRRAGCAGAFIFAWTDEWHRGGNDILDWDFGLTTREREPKEALATIASAFHASRFTLEEEWPSISVVVCTYNGMQTLAECCQGLKKLDYPDYEVIIVNDGSTDGTDGLADGSGFRVIHTDNRGLSAARNTGWQAARGEIVAYLDDDAVPDSDWLHYLALAFHDSEYAGIGGPNIQPPEGCDTAHCVANAPGGPIHVLLTDTEAEHIPGCNMAFRRESLARVGGFDERFWIAGDDVDLCWRLQQAGETLGFSPAAMVWHHRRSSVSGYLRQQRNYGAAEGMLEKKWPEKYNRMGHLSWAGRLYEGNLDVALPFRPQRIYQGVWGTRAFQSVYEPAINGWWSLPLMPEWHLLTLLLFVGALLSLLWEPLRFFQSLWLLSMGASALYALRGGFHARFDHRPLNRTEELRLRAVTAFLYWAQPLARLAGRLDQGLSPWRQRERLVTWRVPLPGVRAIWSEGGWRSPESRLEFIEELIGQLGGDIRRGGNFDSWDLEVRGGVLGAVRLLLVIEEHGDGKQMTRIRTWPMPLQGILVLAFAVALLFPFNMLLSGALLLGALLRLVWELGIAMGFCCLAMDELEKDSNRE